jgi:hypothetical protein
LSPPSTDCQITARDSATGVRTRSEGGAENAAILHSLVVSCKLVGVDPFACFRDVSMRIHTQPAARITDLIPCGRRTRFGAATALQSQSAAQPLAPATANDTALRPWSSANARTA